MTGFEGVGDFSWDADPFARYDAHQASKGRATIGDPDRARKAARENGCGCRKGAIDPNCKRHSARFECVVDESGGLA